MRLEDLAEVNVLHGDNNVGKSNLLEAIGLLFVLLQALREEVTGGVRLAERFARRTPPEQVLGGEDTSALGTARSWAYFAERGFPPDEIFNLQQPRPIRLRAGLLLEPGELDEGAPSWLASPLSLSARLERREDELVIALEELRQADGTRVSPEEGGIARVLERLGRRRRQKTFEPRFALVRADRTVATEFEPGPKEPLPLVTRELLPPELALALHDAESATDPVLRQRFEHFRRALEPFRDLLGDGQWQVRYDRRAERAEVFFDSAKTRVPLRLMGSGVQQVVSLTARIIMTGADIMAVEEPELNLRHNAQLRLREIFRQLVRDSQHPSQLFLTSHSPAFETRELFYALIRSPEGPCVEKRPSTEAFRFTLPEMSVPPEGARAPLSYVTSDGLVLIPEHVRRKLGLEHGGGVVFVRLLRQDTDGLWFVDYLKAILAELDEPEMYPALLEEHRGLVNKRLEASVTLDPASKALTWLWSYHNQVVEECVQRRFINGTQRDRLRLPAQSPLVYVFPPSAEAPD